MTLLLGLTIRFSIVLAVGLLLNACLARRSAALRHRVLAGALLAAVLVLPASLALPEWHVTVPRRTQTAGPASLPSLPAQVLPPRAAAPQTPAPARVSPLLVIWLAGVVAAGGTLIAGLVRVSRLARRARRVDDERWLRALAAVAARYGLRREIVLTRTESAHLLAVWGIRRPRVLLPGHARHWTLARLHVVLCHELAHIHRQDWLVQTAAEAVRALFWFNPLVWMACTRLRRESEQACDDEVLGMGVAAGDYAVHLLELARQCRRPGPWAPALPMAHPSTLERRIAAMLNTRLDRRPPSPPAVAALGLVLLLVALPAGVVRARQAGPAPLAGTIYDVTGAVLPGVEVTLVDASDIAQVTTTNASGRFDFPPVIAGKYVLQVSLAGFRTLRQELELRDTRDWDRAVTLQVGEVKETVIIRGSRATLPRHLKGAGVGREPLRVGGNIRPPRKIRHVRPTYPAAMHAAGLTGVVPVEAIIGRDGTVSSVRVLSAQVHPDFAIAAVDAVRQWEFTPTLLNGEAVEVVMTVSVRFDLEG